MWCCRERQRRRRGIDYNKEVAFEKRPAPGFYDVANENDRTKEVGRQFRPVTLEEMEGKRRAVRLPLQTPACVMQLSVIFGVA